MKILMINRYGYPEYGSENYFINLCQLLKAKGHKVIVFTTKDKRNIDKQYYDYSPDKIDIGNLGPISFGNKILHAARIIYSFQDRQKIERLIKDTRPDIVHIHNLKRLISPAILHSIKKFGLPVVYTLHDYHLICPNYRLFSAGQICEDCQGINYHKAIFKKCIRGSLSFSLLACIEQYVHSRIKLFDNNVDIFITPSNFLREKMIEFGFNPEKLIAIPEFIFSNGQLDYESDRYIVYFGRLVREKGILTLVEAMRNLPLVKLLVIGDGSYRKDLENLVLKQGINNVEFKGYISTDNMKMILKNAMFAVIPSEWYEVFGLVILESFAMGKPVIGANIGAIPELINDGLDGLLFRPGDIRDLTEKITYLFNNKEAIVKMGKSARSKVLKDYNADIHYDRISQVYQNLI